MKLKDSYHPYALITVIFWALAYVFSRLAMQHFSPYPLGFLRYIVASVFLIFAIMFYKIKPPRVKEMPLFIAGGATGFFFYMLTFNKGTLMVPSATSSVIIATVPVITAFLARILYKEKLAFHQWVAIGIEFVGILVLTLWGGTFTINEGILWLLMAALSLSTYNLIQRKMTKTYDPLTITSYSILAGTVMLSIFSPQAISEIKTAPPSQYINLIILGIFSSALAYISWAKAFSKAPNTTVVSNYMFVTPFITAIFGFIFAKEIPDMATFAGGGIIMCGVFLFFKDSFLSNKTKKNID